MNLTHFQTDRRVKKMKVHILHPLLFLVRFASAALFGETSNEILEDYADDTFQIYWNIPTFQCDYHQLNFTGLCDKYGITQNENARFRGEQIVILYDPGDFPALLATDTESVVFRRNGGVPQEGNLTLHLDVFRESVEELVPDANFSGIAVIDFESWRPVFRQNFGSLQPYKDLSVEIERQAHPFWPNALVQKAAASSFEFAARKFMEETVVYAKQLRPGARWGYYAYPYCFNMSPSNMKTECPSEVMKENDRIEWLFEEADNLHPSIYLTERRLNPKQRLQLIQGRINEAHRVIGYMKRPEEPKILPYFWYKYQDTNNFLSKDDLRNAFLELKTSDIDGVVLWGSSNDVNEKKKCYELFDYIDDVLGPVLINT